MKDKIAHLMKSEGLTTTRLAEILEVKPSAVSHLVSGRNNPSYDMLQKILRRFPRVNPDWLLLDSDEPYREDDDDVESIDDASQGDTDDDSLPFMLSTPSGDDSSDDLSGGLFNVSSSSKRGSKSPIFVVLFYDDGSCERFSMR